MSRQEDEDVAGLAHVATVSFLASRVAPSAQFVLALAGGVALARAAAVRSARAGYGASVAAMLQTTALMGPARISGPVTQALNAPLLGRLHARGAGPAPMFAACVTIRLLHYVVLTAFGIWVVLGGIDAYAGSYDRLTGWLGVLPSGAAGALAVTAAVQFGWAIFFSVVQVLVYRRALAAWPAADGEGRADAVAAARGPGRFDPRASALAAVVAIGLLLSGTAWPLLGAVAAWLVIAWVTCRPDPEPLPLGFALAALLAIGAVSGSLIAGLGVEEAASRALRAGLLVLVATWLRAATGPAGLREVFRRVLHRLRWVPSATEAAATLDRLHAGASVSDAGRELATRLGNVERRPVPIAQAVLVWVAFESAGFRAGAGVAAERLAARPRDALLVALAVAPAIALVGG